MHKTKGCYAAHFFHLILQNVRLSCWIKIHYLDYLAMIFQKQHNAPGCFSNQAAHSDWPVFTMNLLFQ